MTRGGFKEYIKGGASLNYLFGPKTEKALHTSFDSDFIRYFRRAAEAEKSLSDYWREVGLSFSLVEKRLTSSNCYSDSTHFLGCVEAVNSVLDQNEPPLELVTRSEGSIRQDFGALKVKESPETDDAIAEDAQRERVENEKRHRAWLALYNEGPGRSTSPPLPVG